MSGAGDPAPLEPNGTGLTLVGDDARSIYSFRSAKVRNMQRRPPWWSWSRTTAQRSPASHLQSSLV